MNMHQFAEHLRELPCKKCPVSLRCMMGRPDPKASFCYKCKGWWVAELHLSLTCGTFDDTQKEGDGSFKAFKYCCPACTTGYKEHRYKGKPMEISRARI